MRNFLLPALTLLCTKSFSQHSFQGDTSCKYPISADFRAYITSPDSDTVRRKDILEGFQIQFAKPVSAVKRFCLGGAVSGQDGYVFDINAADTNRLPSGTNKEFFRKCLKDCDSMIIIDQIRVIKDGICYTVPSFIVHLAD